MLGLHFDNSEFAYDAAGQRTRTQQPNGVKTYYPFPGYEEEVNGSTTTRRTTYSLAGQAVAVRVQVVGGSNVFYYLHSDHVGSTTALSTSAVGGGLISGSTARHLPFGAWRTTPTQTLTDRGFTGHLENMELGLIYMNARYYVPAIGRFASADTIVPESAEPQSLNRYAYTLNNPVNYSDPNGHNPAWCNDPYDGGGGPECEPMVDFTVSNGAGLSWEYDEKLEAIGAASLVDFALVQESGIGFQEVYGSAVTFQKTGKTCAEAFSNETYTCYGSSNGNLINIYTNAEGDLADNTRFFVHELGHSFERAVGDSVPSEAIIATDETDDSVNNRGGFAGPAFGWQQSTDDGAGEIFADMFIGWVYGQWEVDRFTGALTDDAALKANFMTTNMSVWIDTAYPGN